MVTYEFNAKNGETHTGTFMEYFQIGAAVGGKVEGEKNLYPLSFDGIDWRDKESLEEANKGHLFKEFHDAHHSLKVVEEHEVDPHSIVGLLLSDGVFLGNIHAFAGLDIPIVIFNSCGSLLELVSDISFAGARTVIGSMWSILDTEAGTFARTLFEHIWTGKKKWTHFTRSVLW
jgi:hypothetical protein